MIRKNITLAIRLLLKHKSVSFINIIGLSFSLACALFILLWVQHELSFDRFHPDYKSLYRVEENQFYSNPEPYHVNVTPNPSGPVWKDEIPEIMEQCRIAWSGGLLMSYENTKYFENDVVAVDSSYFQMFGFKLIDGAINTVLNQPNSMVISEDIAEKYFGTKDALGKVIKVNNNELFTVTGIMENPPKNTVIPASIFLSWDYRTGGQFYSDSWGNNAIFTYVKLVPGTIDTVVNAKITEVTNIHKEDNTITFEVNPVHRIHLHQYFGFGKSPGAIMYVYIFSAVALFVLIIACINFMNMSTAKSSLRAKEIGLRKVSGASRQRLIRQYLSESFLQTLISIILAVILVIALLNKFNDVSGKDIALSAVFSLKYILGLLSVALFAGILAGLYPAFYLSSFSPIQAIKGSKQSRKGSGVLRKALVVFQFSLSILLISGAFIVSRQLNYMRNADLGFNKYQLINISLKGGANEHYKTLKTEFQKDPKVEFISASMDEAYSIGSNSSSISWPGKDEENSVLVSFTGVDFNFTDAMEIKLLNGRGFSENYLGDVYEDTTANFIINKTLADIINQDEIVDMDLTFMGIHGKIVGIMDDFHFKPLRNEVEPLAICPLPPERFSNMIVRLKTEDLKPALKEMEETWNSLVSQFPFEYSFVDEEIDKMYRSEERMAKLIGIFTVIAVIIACMGLFALASFTAERRTREIGVRKTFGANEGRIVWMMIVDITKLIVIALLVGLPSVWFLANRWLADFSYRIELKPDIFIIASVLTIVVSVITIFYHSLKSARMNPVLALKYE
jgi:putative ABC transport system permease protein